jgi:two-component system response regulator DesR
LTAREHDVLTQLAAGADARQIAQGLGLSVHTVRDHLKAIRKKFGVHSQLDVVIEADRLGMVGLGERFR